MTPEQALAILDNVVAQVSMNRENHVQVQKAVETLRLFISTQSKKAPD